MPSSWTTLSMLSVFFSYNLPWSTPRLHVGTYLCRQHPILLLTETCWSMLLFSFWNCKNDFKSWIAKSFLQLNQNNTTFSALQMHVNSQKYKGLISRCSLQLDKQISSIVSTDFFCLSLMAKIKSSFMFWSRLLIVQNVAARVTGTKKKHNIQYASELQNIHLSVYCKCIAWFVMGWSLYPDITHF